MPIHPRLQEHLRSGQVSRVVYGSIIGLALVLTLELHPPSDLRVVGSLLATAVAVALAEVYSELVGGRAREAMGGTHAEWQEVVEDAVGVALGIAFPSLFFVAAAAGLLDQDTAFTVAKWSGLGLIAGYGYLAGRLSGSGVRAALLEATAVGVIAAVLIGLKALVH